MLAPAQPLVQPQLGSQQPQLGSSQQQEGSSQQQLGSSQQQLGSQQLPQQLFFFMPPKSLSSKQHDFFLVQHEPQPQASSQQPHPSSQPQDGSSQQQLGSSQQQEGSSQQQLGSQHPQLFFLPPKSLSSRQHDFFLVQQEPQPQASPQQPSSQPQDGSSQQQLGSSQQQLGSSQQQEGSSQQQLGSSQQHEGSQQPLEQPQLIFLPKSLSSKQHDFFLVQHEPHPQASSQPQLGSSQQQDGSSQQQLGSSQQSQHEEQLFFLPPKSLSSRQHDFFLVQHEPHPQASSQQPQPSSQPQDGSSQQQLGSSQQHDGSSQQQDGSLAQPHPPPHILSSRPPPKLWPTSEMLSMSAPNTYFIEQLLIRGDLLGSLPPDSRQRAAPLHVGGRLSMRGKLPRAVWPTCSAR